MLKVTPGRMTHFRVSISSFKKAKIKKLEFGVFVGFYFNRISCRLKITALSKNDEKSLTKEKILTGKLLHALFDNSYAHLEKASAWKCYRRILAVNRFNILVFLRAISLLLKPKT